MRQPRRPRAHARPPGRLALAAVVAGGLLASTPATADASRYLFRTAASKITKRFALNYADGQASARRASCWPTGRRHTRRNRGYQWNSWDCSWSMRVTDADGSADACNGKIRIKGKRRGTKRRTLRAAQCEQVKVPAPAPAPAPAPGPQPGPGGKTRQQQMTDAAIHYGIQYATDLINGGGLSSGLFYFGQINRPECVLLSATKVRCPMFLWWEDHFQDSNFHIHTTREIYRAFVFAEDLGTSVGFNTNIEPQGILSYDPGHPWQWLCSDLYSNLQPCPASRTPIAYPAAGPPYPNPQ